MRLSPTFGDDLSESAVIWVMRLASLPHGVLLGVAIRVVGCSPWRKLTTAIAVSTPVIGTPAGAIQFILLQSLLYQLAKLQPPERLHRSQVACLQPSAKSRGGQRIAAGGVLATRGFSATSQIVSTETTCVTRPSPCSTQPSGARFA